MSYIIMFLLVLKQPLCGTLVLSDSRSSPRLSLDLRLDQRSYPLSSQGIEAMTWEGLCVIAQPLFNLLVHACEYKINKMKGYMCVMSTHILKSTVKNVCINRCPANQNIVPY